MIEKSFPLDKRTFERRVPSTIQHKLRVLLKCYTVNNFVMREDNTFSFKKSYRIHGIRIDDPKEIIGRFTVNDISEKEVLLTLRII